MMTNKIFGVGAFFLGLSGESKQKIFYGRPQAVKTLLLLKTTYFIQVCKIWEGLMIIPVNFLKIPWGRKHDSDHFQQTS